MPPHARGRIPPWGTGIRVYGRVRGVVVFPLWGCSRGARPPFGLNGGCILSRGCVSLHLVLLGGDTGGGAISSAWEELKNATALSRVWRRCMGGVS